MNCGNLPGEADCGQAIDFFRFVCYNTGAHDLYRILLVKGCKNDLSEFPFRGKMLVCDMDGTLLNTRSRISEKNLGAINRFVEGGGLFTVATGRMDKAVEPYLAQLPLSIPAIVYNGAAIYDFSAKKILWQNCLPDNLENVAVKLLERFPEGGLEIFHGGDLFLVSQNIETTKHTMREGFHPIPAKLKDIPKPWFKMLIAWEPKRLAEVEEFLKGMEEEFRAVYSEPQFLELLNSSVSKGNALMHLAAMVNIPCECIIAMGDNRNDIELLQVAGIGVAVGNAHRDVAEAADLTCGCHDEDAVAEVIGWIEDGSINCRLAV